MVPNRLAFAALGVACVAAAAGGAYVATRHNAADPPATSTAFAPAVDPQGAPTVVTPPVPPDSAASPAAEPARTTPAASPATRTAESAARPAAARSTTRPSNASGTRKEPQAPSKDHAAQNAIVPAPVLPADPAPLARVDERSLDLPKAPEPPPPAFEELTVASDSVIGLQTETTLSSERARIEDRVEARVVRDVRVGGRVAIPAGTRALGSVVVVERGGKMKDRARLGIRFHTLAFADGTKLPITTETIYRYGDAPGNGSAAKIGGGAVAGAILGAIIGGGKGAAIGAATGAGGGSAAVMASDRSEAVFPAGAEVTARIVSPVTVTVDR
jgi:type IV secretory pathway VirB10-like protein